MSELTTMRVTFVNIDHVGLATFESPSETGRFQLELQGHMFLQLDNQEHDEWEVHVEIERHQNGTIARGRIIELEQVKPSTPQEQIAAWSEWLEAAIGPDPIDEDAP